MTPRAALCPAPGVPAGGDASSDSDYNPRLDLQADWTAGPPRRAGGRAAQPPAAGGSAAAHPGPPLAQQSREGLLPARQPAAGMALGCGGATPGVVPAQPSSHQQAAAFGGLAAASLPAQPQQGAPTASAAVAAAGAGAAPGQLHAPLGMAGLLDAASGQLPDVEQSVLWLQSMEQEVGSCLEAAPVNLHAQRFAGGDASFADDRGGG